MGKLCCLIDIFIGCIQSSVTDILHNRSGKQMCILKHNSKGPSQIILFNLVDVDSIVTDLSILYIVETIDQVGDRRLSGSGRAYEGNLLTRLCVKCEIVKYHFFICITKSHVKEAHISF